MKRLILPRYAIIVATLFIATNLAKGSQQPETVQAAAQNIAAVLKQINNAAKLNDAPQVLSLLSAHAQELSITRFIELIQKNATEVQKFCEDTVNGMKFAEDYQQKWLDSKPDILKQINLIPTFSKKLDLVKPYTRSFDAALQQIVKSLQDNKNGGAQEKFKSALTLLNNDLQKFYTLFDYEIAVMTLSAMGKIIDQFTHAQDLDFDQIVVAVDGLNFSLPIVAATPQLLKSIGKFLISVNNLLDTNEQMPPYLISLSNDFVALGDATTKTLKEIKDLKSNGIVIAHILNEILKFSTNIVIPDAPITFCYTQNSAQKMVNGTMQPQRYDAKEEKTRNDTYANNEPLFGLIQKYAPIFYLHHKERGFPMHVEEYFTGENSALKLGSETLAPMGTVTMKLMHDLNKKYKSNDALFFEIKDCVKSGSNPALNSDEKGILKTPVYVITSEKDGKIYIQYMTFYGFNVPYHIAVLKGDISDFQNGHESDLEHVTLEIDKNTQKLIRIYYGAHGRDEGVWLDANHPWIEYEGTRPIAYVANGGHGLYPQAGSYVRIHGMANDVTEKGMRWDPELVMMYPDTDPRFNVNTMGWMYHAGGYGRRGVSSAASKSWFMDYTGDVGRPIQTVTETFCANSLNMVERVNCKIKAVIKAIIPE